MLDRVSEVELQTFRHANVVRALAVAFGADTPETLEVIKSKLKHLYGEGFAPPAKGRGREIQYEFYDIMDWAIALTLISLGLPPKIMLKKLNRGYYDKYLSHVYSCTELYEKQVYILFFCNLLVDQIPHNPDLWKIIDSQDELRKTTDRSMMIGLDYAVSNFTKTRATVISELRKIIEAGIRP